MSLKATGIVRRIDDLGRVAIPKEIRRTLRLHDGDPVEIYIENDGIFLKKYSSLAALDADVAHAAVKAIRNLGFKNAAVYSRFDVVFSSCSTMAFSRITPSEADAFSFVRKISVLDAEKGLWIIPIIIKGENQGFVIGSEAEFVTGDTPRKSTVSALFGIVEMLECIAEYRENG